MCIIKSLVAYQQSIRRVACDNLGRVDIYGIITICQHLPYPIINGQK